MIYQLFLFAVQVILFSLLFKFDNFFIRLVLLFADGYAVELYTKKIIELDEK